MFYLYLSAKYLRIEESLDRQPTVSYHGLLQGRSSLTNSVSLVLDGIFFHASLEAFLQSAVPALVPLVLVHGAAPGEPAAVGVFLPHAPSEESLTAIAGGGAVVLASGSITTYSAVLREYGGTLRRGQSIVCQN